MTQFLFILHYSTVHVNNGWMSTVDEYGFGNIIEGDLVRLMENKGFRVDQAETLPLDYKLSKEFVEKVYEPNFFESFPKVDIQTRIRLSEEYNSRVKEMSNIIVSIKDERFLNHNFLKCFRLLAFFVQDGYYHECHDFIKIFGEKPIEN